MGKNINQPKNKPLKPGTEIRAFSMLDLAARDEEGGAGNTIQGHAAVFGQTTVIGGMWKETIARGAFDKTDFTDVLFDANHNLQSIPLARSRNNNANSTLQLQVDDQGLNTRATLDVEDNSDAKALYSAVKRGDVNGMSFIFAVADDEWAWPDDEKELPSRTIKEISKVYEVSAVSMPAYAGTDISARSSDALESARRTLESARAAKLESLKPQEERNAVEALRLRAQILMKG